MDAAIREGQALGQGFRLGELRVDPRAGEVSGPAGRAQLDPRVMDVLVMLAQHAGQVVLREALLARLWPNSVVTDDALSRCIYDLRRQLALAGGNEQYRAMLETVPKRGYRLVGAVTPLDLHPGAQSPRRAAWLFPVLAVLAAVGAVTALWFAISRESGGPESGRQSSSANAAQHSIAVLPFLDLSPTQDQAYLADGIAEDVLDRLVQAANLRVIARTSSFAFRGKPADIRDIAAKLGVSHVLEGSIRRSGDRIRITAQLIAASDNAHVWSETIDRDLGELFAVQDEIAASVATALQVKLAGGAPHGRMPESVEAYEQFLQGGFFYGRRAPGDIQRAILYYEQAVSSDPDYARAWAALAGAYRLALDERPNEATLRAKQGAAAKKAVELDPRLAVAHVRLAHFYFSSREFSKANEHMREAIKLDPDDTLVLSHLSNDALERDDVGKAIKLQRQVVARDPLSIAERGNFALLLMSAGRLDEAMSEYLRLLSINPEAGQDFEIEVVRILILQGQPGKALAAIRRFPEGKLRDHGLALLFRAPGQLAEADAALSRLAKAPADIMDSIRLAEVYAFRGMPDEAFRALQHRVEELERTRRSGEPTFWYFRHEARGAPFLKTLHADPRWALLMAHSD